MLHPQPCPGCPALGARTDPQLLWPQPASHWRLPNRSSHRGFIGFPLKFLAESWENKLLDFRNRFDLEMYNQKTHLCICRMCIVHLCTCKCIYSKSLCRCSARRRRKFTCLVTFIAVPLAIENQFDRRPGWGSLDPTFKRRIPCIILECRACPTGESWLCMVEAAKVTGWWSHPKTICQLKLIIQVRKGNPHIICEPASPPLHSLLCYLLASRVSYPHWGPCPILDMQIL